MGRCREVHAQSEDGAQSLTYQLAMENFYIVPDDWSSIASAWCRCTGVPQRRPAAEWCEHAAAIMSQLADLCDHDPFFVYHMRGVHLALHASPSCFAQLHAVGEGPKRQCVDNLAETEAGSASQPVLIDD